MKKFYSHGKLLLTGEYVVLDGALSLAIPTLYGQSLVVENGEKCQLKWVSLDDNEDIWFEAEFVTENNEILNHDLNHTAISKRLLQILKAAQKLNPTFLSRPNGYTITTRLGFPKNWGLGTSSTLINNIANWAQVDPYQLLEMTFGGSGYDIACAEANSALTYQLSIGNIKIERDIKSVGFNPTFHQNLYFVHLNQKQNSRDGIAQYRQNNSDLSASISKINIITKEMITCESLVIFQKLIDEHEQIISGVIKQTPVKALLFDDFKGSIKSLGAWGGDFIMVASKDNPTTYFKDKGYHTIISYSDMVKT